MHVASPPLAILDFLGGGELILIFTVVLIFFGGEKLPEFARGFGKVMKEFRKAANEVEREFKNALDEADQMKANAAKAITPDLGLDDAPVKTVTPPVNPPSLYTPHPDTPPAPGSTPAVTPPPVAPPPAADGDAHIDA